MPDLPGDWLPRHGWKGFAAPYRLDDEERLWRRYLDEYRPAWREEYVFPEDRRRRATEIAVNLTAEATNVQRVARWRRHFPAEDFKQLQKWLPAADIQRAVTRLRRLGMLQPPHWIVG